ncbi:Cytosolic Fe-S cluster assembly factor nubp1 [Glugoides intestinalis]
MQKCPSITSGQAGKAEGCKGCPNATICASATPDEDIPIIKKNLESLKLILAVLSGKGGVGKSTISRNIAASISKQGIKTVVLDFDLSGPSIPRLTCTEDKYILDCNSKFTPILVEENLGVISVGHLERLDENIQTFTSNLKNYIIKKMLKLCDFTGYEVMVIDTPPNITEEHLALVNYIKPQLSIMVTTPQVLSLNDVRRQVSFCKKADIKMLGLIENMKNFSCAKCGHLNSLYPDSGIEEFCRSENISFLGSIPLQGQIAKSSDSGEAVNNQIFEDISQSIIQGLNSGFFAGL